MSKEFVCPYNRSHVMKMNRAQYHLIKCRKKHPGVQFRTCPFNATHLIPPEDFEYHLLTCQDKVTIELQGQLQKVVTNERGSIKRPSYHHPEIAPSSEKWDQEEDERHDISTTVSICSADLELIEKDVEFSGDELSKCEDDDRLSTPPSVTPPSPIGVRRERNYSAPRVTSPGEKESPKPVTLPAGRARLLALLMKQ